MAALQEVPTLTKSQKRVAAAGQPSKSTKAAGKRSGAAKTIAANTLSQSRGKSVPTPTVPTAASAARISATAHDIAKMSVSMPATIAKAVRAVAGRGQVSAYVTHALERQLALDRLAAYVDDVERNLGRPISDELMDEAAAAWHGA